MNSIVAFNFSRPSDIALQIADRVKTRRLEFGFAQKGWQHEHESS